MIRASIIGFLLAVIGTEQTMPSSAPPSQEYDVSGDLSFDEKKLAKPLPYELMHGLIFFKATIAGRSANVVLDSAANTIVDESFARKAGLSLRKIAHSIQTPGAYLPTFIATAGSYQIGPGLHYKGDLPALDLTALSSALGRPIDAVLGSDTLKYFAVDVQRTPRQMIFALSGQMRMPVGTVKLPLTDKGELLVSINDQPVNLGIDTGSDGTVTLFKKTWDRVIGHDGASSTGLFVYGDGVVRTKKTTSARFTVGRLPVQDIEVSGNDVSDNAEAAGQSGMIGNGFLSRGRFILDLGAKQLSLLPGGDWVRRSAKGS